jgi:putative transposase
LSPKIRKTLVRIEYKDISISRQCELLTVARSVVYYEPKPKPDDTVIANLIYDIWYKNPEFGVRRMTDKLRLDGLIINKKKVHRLYRQMGIQAIYTKPKTSIKDDGNRTFPYLLKEMDITKPNQVWMTDITYIRLRSGFVYLCALIDVYSRYIVGYNISNTMDALLCTDTLDNALVNYSKPEIINSDQGSQFTGEMWINKLISNNIKISHTGTGRCIDNVYIERFWRSIKHEKINLSEFNSINELERIISNYILHYNNDRPHRSLQGKTPNMIYNS